MQIQRLFLRKKAQELGYPMEELEYEDPIVYTKDY